MDSFDELLIKKYLHIDKEISKLYEYKNKLKEVFYSQNMATHLVYDAHGVHSEGFRQDIKVINYLESLDIVEERINRYRIRKNYFKEFICSLSDDEKEKLSLKCLNKIPPFLFERIIGEIREIETAINFRYGIEPENFDVVLTENMNVNVERMCDFFAI
ncbi:hypothetical protein ACFFIF_08040 [Vagococcus entomophilus]|uniref:Uncharacterized protein n=1 Tax=Vagococcus entomophilus TaxID=1160095 RepID=A0A430AHN3_9ENTE|nr:hypothetical protein [Vagococcus entomophilus]RSU07287.1 hypothetical protein CBF30_08525 [Vagococcus entomophilus]